MKLTKEGSISSRALAVSDVVHPARIRRLNNAPVLQGPVIYWMSRDQRVDDNWALIYAQELAAVRTPTNARRPLAVAFCLAPSFLSATMRQYAFMLDGLKEVESRLRALRIPFFLLAGNPDEEISTLASRHGAGAVVTDFDPLAIKKSWREKAAKSLSCALFEVDAHNVVPCRLASQKLEYGAYTLRPKINRLLTEFLTGFPAVRPSSEKRTKWKGTLKLVSWPRALSALKADKGVAKVDWINAGPRAAKKALKKFITKGVFNYDEKRNDPNARAQSDLSPYLHFGQLSAQRVALSVLASSAPRAAKDAFLEELIVRRELADNFCLYCEGYDSTQAFPAWARETLAAHASDAREYTYSLAKFEQAKTHDALWNAAQNEMMKTGKMHGYMRMYWAKKILEWTKSPNDAMKIAIYLNDRYELDGRDPSGYAGIAWAIGGVHDRAWPGRPVFGKIRYMNERGCRSKFDVDAYIAKWNER